MQEAIEDLIVEPSVPADVAEHIERAEKWAGEPFLHPGEDPERVLAEGTARRRALDDAIAEMDAGERVPTPKWKVRYGLMLGLERVLSDKPPRLASGTELRRHQVDALAGMLTELIAANQQPAELNGNGNGAVVEVEEEEDEDFELEGPEDEEPETELTPEQDPGAKRRYRFRHPTASGKTIAAAGFVEAARTLGVLILTHRRLLVTQFDRELKAEGYGDRITPAITEGTGADPRQPAHDPDVRLVRAARRLALARRVPARDLRRGAHGAGREDERRDPVVPASRSTSA